MQVLLLMLHPVTKRYADLQSVMQKLTICHLESFPGIWYSAEQYNHQDFIHRSINIIAAKKPNKQSTAGASSKTSVITMCGLYLTLKLPERQILVIA